MPTPQTKMWKKTVRWRMLSGLLIGMGIGILLVVTYLLNQGIGVGFTVGLGLSLAGFAGLLTA